MTTTAFRKPWEDGARGYHEADSTAAAKEGFKRVRTDKDFILTDHALAQEVVHCARCTDRVLVGQPNRATYHAATKTVSVRHYVCGWGDTLDAVEEIARETR